MSMLSRSLKIAGAILLLPMCQSCLVAQGTTPVHITPDNTGLLKVDDVVHGRRLFTQELAWYDKWTYVSPDTLEPTVTRVDTENGFDLRFKFTNTSESAKKIGRIRVSGLEFDRNTTEYLDHFQGISFKSAADSSFWLYPKLYPDSLYSPVAVLRDANKAAGVSLQYPVLAYKHSVRVMVLPSKVQGSQRWSVYFEFLNVGNEHPTLALGTTPLLQPGDTHTYTVSVRFDNNPDEWIRTLVPYRDYFHSLYGDVKYDRNTSSIRGYFMATQENLSPTNPYGYAFPNRRPDTNGWAPTMQHIKGVSGWDSTLIWQATGYYRTNLAANMPSLFASPFLDRPAIAGALSPSTGFPSLVSSGRSFGLWWGHSAEYADRWDPSSLEDLNPSNPVHRAAAFREMDIAVAAGASVIGLDAFIARHMPVWTQMEWLNQLQTRYPDIRFITEPTSCDIIHTVCPSWVLITTNSPNPLPQSEWHRVTSPHVLADFFLPGHETVGSYSFQQLKLNQNRGPTESEVNATAQWLGSLGYVPLVFTIEDLVAPVQVAKSWEFTIPADIRPGASASSASSGSSSSSSSGSGSTPSSSGGSGSNQSSSGSSSSQPTTGGGQATTQPPLATVTVSGTGSGQPASGASQPSLPSTVPFTVIPPILNSIPQSTASPTTPELGSTTTATGSGGGSGSRGGFRAGGGGGSSSTGASGGSSSTGSSSASSGSSPSAGASYSSSGGSSIGAGAVLTFGTTTGGPNPSSAVPDGAVIHLRRWVEGDITMPYARFTDELTDTNTATAEAGDTADLIARSVPGIPGASGKPAHTVLVSPHELKSKYSSIDWRGYRHRVRRGLRVGEPATNPATDTPQAP
ncbi:MAG: hypothetical protein H6815_02390 [Phycisphaeraceae bacterium]|nr:hypothetical protein [Phycisphaerales bacterium]MCB9859276.1 hypothetical protein [Phycisphaeraceae bacterium]